MRKFLWKMSPKNGKTQISKKIMLLWDGDGGEWTGLGWSQRMKLFQRIPCVANFQVLQKIFSILLLLGKIRKSTQIPKGSFHFEILRWGSPDPSSTIDQNWKNFKRGRGIGTLSFCSQEGKLISYRSPIKKLKILGKTFFVMTHLSLTLTQIWTFKITRIQRSWILSFFFSSSWFKKRMTRRHKSSYVELILVQKEMDFDDD